MSGLAAGVDGCRAGWLVVVRPLEDPAAAQVRLAVTFAEVLALVPEPGVIAVDIPIGLPDRGVPGGRACDVAARANLGGRQSSVFAVPSREAVMCEDYAKACRVAERTSQPARKVSKQAFNIFAKVREVDRLMTPELQQRVFEVHPEVAFWALNDECPLDLPKKVKSRPFPPGLDLRRSLLEAAGYSADFMRRLPFKASEAGPDDLLDAAVNSWSAARIARGEAVCFPCEPDTDSRGLRMEIRG